MGKYLFYCTLFILPICSFSQVTSISGKIMIEELSESVDFSSVNVINETTNAKVKANSLGIFTLKVSKDDELAFTSGFTEKRVIKITESIIKKGFITVHLDLETIQLAEANINPLKKNLKDNLDYKPDKLDDLYKELGIDPNLRFRKIDPTYTSQVGGGFGPISALIGYLNGSTKKAKYTYKYFKDVNKKGKIEEYFTASYFMNDLKIPEHKVSEFITYCYDKKELNLKVLIVGNRYEEIEEILEKEAPLYLDLLNQK